MQLWPGERTPRIVLDLVSQRPEPEAEVWIHSGASDQVESRRNTKYHVPTEVAALSSYTSFGRGRT
jgi:hypothetical protein